MIFRPIQFCQILSDTGMTESKYAQAPLFLEHKLSGAGKEAWIISKYERKKQFCAQFQWQKIAMI